jgi:hypothetical protein
MARWSTPRSFRVDPHHVVVSTVTSRPTARELWKRGQRGWPADFPLAQLPNAPLLAALAGWLAAALTRGLVHDCARATFYAGLAVWAGKELEDGVNWARRGIGAAALLFVVARIDQHRRASPRLLR